MLQTGKSFTMTSIVRAVVAQDPNFGVGKRHEPMVLEVNASKIQSTVSPSSSSSRRLH